MKKGDELMPPPRPGRRNWTRAEDYLPQRRSRRAPGRQLTARPSHLDAEDHGHGRPSLGIVPFALLMLGLAVLAVAIAITAWPGSRPVQAARAVAAEPGTAAPGWLDRR